MGWRNCCGVPSFCASQSCQNSTHNASVTARPRNTYVSGHGILAVRPAELSISQPPPHLAPQMMASSGTGFLARPTTMGTRRPDSHRLSLPVVQLLARETRDPVHRDLEGFVPRSVFAGQHFQTPSRDEQRLFVEITAFNPPCVGTKEGVFSYPTSEQDTHHQLPPRPFSLFTPRCRQASSAAVATLGIRHPPGLIPPSCYIC